MNVEALAKLMSGGGISLERLNISINWVQTFGVVLAIEVALPKR